jgi:glucose/mannose-6-phosphate isomerase
VRDLTLPYAVDERSLFIACSYSGNTEETLELFGQAAQARARVLAIGRGGILAERAKAVGIPYITVGVATEPRTAVGYNYMLLAGALKQAGLAAISDAAAAAAIDALERSVPKLQEDSPLADNPAKQLAAALLNKLIVVYGGGLFYGVARRWKSQFNENAKVWAFSEAMPEVLHNSVEAYPSSSPVGGSVMALLLQPSPAQDRHARHYKAVSRLLEKDRIEYQVVTAGAGSPQEQQLQMLLLGDYVSYYLAIAQGVDPAPNPSIDKAKKLLAGLD